MPILELVCAIEASRAPSGRPSAPGPLRHRLRNAAPSCQPIAGKQTRRDPFSCSSQRPSISAAAQPCGHGGTRNEAVIVLRVVDLDRRRVERHKRKQPTQSRVAATPKHHAQSAVLEISGAAGKIARWHAFSRYDLHAVDIGPSQHADESLRLARPSLSRVPVRVRREARSPGCGRKLPDRANTRPRFRLRHAVFGEPARRSSRCDEP
jgi:hypothetical protein